MRVRNIFGIVTMAICTAAVAGPIQRGDVPADAGWVLHMDCDALRPTSMGQFLLAEMSKPEAENKFTAFQMMFNFDPRTALHGITLYSAGKDPQDGVLVVYADFDSARLVTFAKAAKEYQSTAHRTHTIHNWIDEKKKSADGGVARTYAAIYGNRVIFGQSEARVGLALDAIDRLTPNLAGTASALASLGSPVPAGSGVFVQAAARKMDLPAGDPNAAMFRLSQGISLELAEAQEQIKATMVLEAGNDEVAVHLTSIVQGVVSLMKLQQEKPEAVKLAQAMAIKQDGSKVVGTLTLSASELLEAMKASAARKASQPAN